MSCVDHMMIGPQQCSRRHLQFDPYGDHLQTCQIQSTAHPTQLPVSSPVDFGLHHDTWPLRKIPSAHPCQADVNKFLRRISQGCRRISRGFLGRISQGCSLHSFSSPSPPCTYFLSSFRLLLCHVSSLLWINEAKVKDKTYVYECRCNGRLQTKRFTRLAHTGFVVELEHLKIKTRLTNEKFASVKGECAI
jgi:hypothetical protein